MIDSSQHLNCHSNFIPMIAALGGNNFAGHRDEGIGRKARTNRDNGEAEMSIEMAAAIATAEPMDAEGCFSLGMIYSSGAARELVDLVEAHKWFNIAAMRGHADAAAMRREIAEQMADAEIGRAQRAARDWLKAHPQETVEAPAIHVAA
jgi:uncharacterized protein